MVIDVSNKSTKGRGIAKFPIKKLEKKTEENSKITKIRVKFYNVILYLVFGLNIRYLIELIN